MRAATVKRLKIRLKATDRGSLVRMFGENVRPNGVLIKTATSLQRGAPVLVELCYQGGALALRGEGEVAEARPATGTEAAALDIALEWNEESRSLVSWILDQVARRPKPVKPLAEDLLPPAPKPHEPPEPQPLESKPLEPPERPEPAPRWEPQDTEPLPPELLDFELRASPIDFEPPVVPPEVELRASPIDFEPPVVPSEIELRASPLDFDVPVVAPEVELRASPIDFEVPVVPPEVELQLAPPPPPPELPEPPSPPSLPERPQLLEPSRPEPPPAAHDDEPLSHSSPEPSHAGAVPIGDEPLEGQAIAPHADLKPLDIPTLDLTGPSAPAVQAPLTRTLGDSTPDFLPPVENDRISTEYSHYAIGAPRDEIGPGPVPNALRAGEAVPKAPLQPLSSTVDRQSGEVTPLARIELVRQPPAPVAALDDNRALDDAAGTPLATAIRSKRARRELPAKSRVAIGIDFGTSATRAAVMQNGRVRLIPSRRGPISVASAILIDPAGTTIIGEPAIRQARTRPDRVITGGKRLIGRPFHSVAVQDVRARYAYDLSEGDDGETAVRFGDYLISLEELSALILKEIRESAVEYIGERVNRAVVAVPGHFSERQREAVRIAGELAGFHVERLISGPIAASMTFTLGRPGFGGRLLVYDLGGGTFDASLVDVEGQIYKAIANAGDPFLGGTDFDAEIAERLAEEVLALREVDPRGDPGAMAQLGQAAERMKRELSEHPVTRVSVEDLRIRGADPIRFEMPVSRALIEPLLDPLVERTLRRCLELCARAKTAPSEIDHLIMVGGQTLAPVVRRRMRELLEMEPAALQFEAEHAIAIGAARYAERMDDLGAPTPIEVLSEGIGIALPGGRFKRILLQDTPLPASNTYRFDVTLNGQSSYPIYLFQGENEGVLDNEPIGALSIGDFPSGAASVSVTVSLHLSHDGILGFSAVEDRTGQPLSTKLFTKLASDELRELFAPPEPISMPIPPSITETSAPELPAAVPPRPAGLDKDGGGLFGWIKKTLGGPKRV